MTIIKSLIFDFDGLIIDTETIQFKEYRNMLSKYNIVLGLDEWQKDIGSESCFSLKDQMDNLKIDKYKIKQKLDKQIDKHIKNVGLRKGIIHYFKQAKK